MFSSIVTDRNIKIDAVFYKTLSTYDDWQKITSNVAENYLLLENKKIDEVLSKFGLEGSDFPSKIEIKENSFKLTNGEKRKIFTFATDCITNVLDNLDSEKIKVDDKAKINVNGETQTLKCVEIQMSENDLFMLQKEFLTGLKKDKILQIP